MYTLGLFIYCVFEGLSNVRRNLASAFPIDPDVEFPEFKRSPLPIRDLIRRCTIDAPEWEEGTPRYGPPRAGRVIRFGSLMYPEQAFDGHSSAQPIASQVMEAGVRWWETELSRAEAFLETDQWRGGNFGAERPTLNDVMNTLNQMASVLE